MPKFNIFRDGKVHVMSEECATCIFKPHERPVRGGRVAEMVKDTMDDDGSTVVCHHTLYGSRGRKHAICRGWFDRLGDRDNVIRMAVGMDMIEYQEVDRAE